jgi:hypothetical protein
MAQAMGNLFREPFKEEINGPPHLVPQIDPVDTLLVEVPGEKDLSKPGQYSNH